MFGSLNLHVFVPKQRIPGLLLLAVFALWHIILEARPQRQTLQKVKDGPLRRGV
jgi:hypothetical protein